MAKLSTIKRFRANPVEYAIFATVTLLFAHSVFTLLNDSESFRFNAITPMAANPVTESRSLASTAGGNTFLNIELKCEVQSEQATSSTKARLTGPLCGIPNKDSLAKASVTNEANHFIATVFTDLDTGKFSTDYIPLSAGKNTIRAEFTYKGGKSFNQTVVLNRD